MIVNRGGLGFPRSKDLKMMTHQHNICTSRVNPFFSKINGPTRYIVPRRISTPPYAPDLSRSLLHFLKKHPQNFHKIHQTSFLVFFNVFIRAYITLSSEASSKYINLNEFCYIFLKCFLCLYFGRSFTSSNNMWTSIQLLFMLGWCTIWYQLRVTFCGALSGCWRDNIK